MNNLSDLPWAVIVSVAGSLLTVAAAWGAINKVVTRMGKDIDDHGIRLAANEKQAEQNRMDLAMYKLTAAETYVREADLGKMEERIGKRLDTVEHTVRNAMTQIMSLASAGLKGIARE